VICRDDQFHPSITEWCDELPRKGEVYTIRDVVAATCPANGLRGPGLKFEELNNYFSVSDSESSFSDWRFDPIDQYSEAESEPRGAASDTLRTELRDPNFLVWLEQLLGEWQVNELSIDIRRRDDGWLIASELPGFKLVSLRLIMEKKAALIKRPEGPLGPTPVILSEPLMQCWLNEDDLERLNGAWRVSYGQKLIYETIEKRILELSVKERLDRWIPYWHFWTIRCPMSHRDLLVHKDLYEIYQEETA
jgi:hypothetical protein